MSPGTSPSTGTPRSRARLSLWRAVGTAFPILALLVVPAGLASLTAAGPFGSPAHEAPLAVGSVPSAAPISPAVAAHPATEARPAAVRSLTIHPADPTDNFTCFKVNTSICISAQAGYPNVIPSPGNTTSPVEPFANQTMCFWVKSMLALTKPTSIHQITNLTPLRLNVTGVLWNGDPYMSPYSYTVWHVNNNSNAWNLDPNPVLNKTYPYWYSLCILNATAAGSPNFFPGESVAWDLYVVTQLPDHQIIHVTSPMFHYRYAQAWAYSPYSGAEQYGGPAAAELDLTVNQNPIQPNWDDAVTVTIGVTAADLAGGNDALLGGGWLDLNETAPSGALLASLTLPFQSHSTALGANEMTVTVPASLAQIGRATVTYTLTAYDAVDPAKYGPDFITSTPFNYTVGGNGTFVSDIFSDDLQVITTPASVAGYPHPILAPNASVSVLISSRNPGTAILSAEASYTFVLPSVRDKTVGAVLFTRLNSTNFRASLPQLPVGGYLNFSLLVWDFHNRLEVQTGLGYSVETFASVVPTVPPSLAFLWIYVYDNGTHTWVTGAEVTVAASDNFVNLQTKSVFGVSYSNATNKTFTPLLLPANVTYAVTVTDPWFVPAAGGTGGPVTVDVTLRNPSQVSQTLQQGPSTTVVQATLAGTPSATQLFFWLNTTPPGPSYAPSPPVGPVLYGPILGLAAAMVAVVTIVPWWNQILKRRREQEKRVTL